MIVYGHRGAAGEAPENTLAGFQHAMDQGIRHFELDLRCAHGGEIVVVHDMTLHRTHASRASVARRHSTDLSARETRPGPYTWARSTGIPTLHAVVQQCRKARHFQFEVKTGQLGDHAIFCERLARFIREHRMAGRVTITSLDPELLSAMAHAGPELSIGLVADHDKPDPVALARRLGCDTLVLSHELVTARRISRAREAGLVVSCWTVNTLPVVTSLFHLGVDSIITDYPTAMLAHVRMLQQLTLNPAHIR